MTDKDKDKRFLRIFNATLKNRTRVTGKSFIKKSYELIAVFLN